MQSYTQLISPTAVTHSIALPFLSSSANNLVIAKTSLLQIFAIKSVVADTTDQGQAFSATFSADFVSPNEAVRKERVHTTKLVLIAQYALAGTVTALARVRAVRSKSGGELLLVSAQDAKLSLIEWDAESYGISTVSIHYFEREEFRGSPWDGNLGYYESHLAVDPGSRCAALKFGARHVAVLPFHHGYDLVMDDVDGNAGEKPRQRGSVALPTNGESASTITPYTASFVLSLLALDPILIHPVHLAFLHGYREPTLAVLSSAVAPSSNLLHSRRDVMSYTVYTLDLDQRASTTLLSVTGLPNGLHAILPLSAPIGGALLVGLNEFIHVDEAGKTNGVAVNGLTSKCTSFPLVSQSELNLRLEGCVVEPLGGSSGDLLIVLNDGQLCVLSFHVDGRSVSGLFVNKIEKTDGGRLLDAAASCMANIGRGRIFVGSEDSASLVLGYSSKSHKLKRHRSKVASTTEPSADHSDFDEDVDGEEEDEDDLYASAKRDPATESTSASSPTDAQAGDYLFRIHDTLMNLSPLADLTTIRSKYEKTINRNSTDSDLYVCTGRGRNGHLVRLSPSIRPYKLQATELEGVESMWPLRMKGASLTDDESCHNVLITSTKNAVDEAELQLYKIDGDDLLKLGESDLGSIVGAVVEMATFCEGTRIVQIGESEVRTYEEDFSLAQIVSLADDATGADPRVLSASFAEPYVLVLLDDASVTILKADETGDLDVLDKGDRLSATRWMSGSLYDDVKDIFRLESDDDEEEDPSSVLMFLLSEDGGLQVYQLPNLKTPVYTAPGLSLLPPFLSSDFAIRRAATREDLVEILVAELGDATAKSPYLILRSASNEVTIYQPYLYTAQSKTAPLRFLKASHSNIPRASAEQDDDEDDDPLIKRRQPLRAMNDVDGFSTVVMPGPSPCLIVKSAASEPQVIDLKITNIRSVSDFHTRACPRGFAFIDYQGRILTAQLPLDANYSTGWVVQTVFSDERIRALAYHEMANRFVLGTSRQVDFKLPADELHPEWATESTTLLPRVDKDTVKLFDPITRTITDTYPLEDNEVIMSIKSLSLEVSEVTHRQRPLIAVGTAVVRGEDITTQGRIHIIDIIEVVPEPGRPETGVRFKLVAMEEVKGAVTALSAVGTEGLLLVAEGQKCMVRGLKEDGTFLPVALMDMQCYAGIAKELPESGLCILGDAIKGIWFAGYNEDPYSLRLFGRSEHTIEVVAADFLPDREQLYVVIADADNVLQILQFDPQNPKSLSGQRLLPLSTFHAGAYASQLTLLPRRATSYEALAATAHDAMDLDASHGAYQILLTSTDGSLGLLTPLSAHAYRSLNALQSFLTNTLPHPLGLNPRAHRSAEADPGVGGRVVLDGDVLKRWMELGSWKRAEGLARAGVESEWEVRMMLEGVGGRGLEFA